MLRIEGQYNANNLPALRLPYGRSYEEAASFVRKFKVRHRCVLIVGDILHSQK